MKGAVGQGPLEVFVCVRERCRPEFEFKVIILIGLFQQGFVHQLGGDKGHHRLGHIINVDELVLVTFKVSFEDIYG